MPRTDADMIGAITEVDDTISLSPFIDFASQLVDEGCATVVKEDGSPYYTETRLTQIETLLAAHFYHALKDRLDKAINAGRVREEYDTKIDTGLAFTPHGQQAMRLDTNGWLALMDNTMRTIKTTVLPVGGTTSRVTWLGTD